MSRMEDRIRAKIENHIRIYGQMPSVFPIALGECFTNVRFKPAASARIGSVVQEYAAAGWNINWKDLCLGDMIHIEIS